MTLRVISISGLDGSGKSTQARMIIEYFEKNGNKTCYFHATQFSIAQKLFSSRSKNFNVSDGVTEASRLAVLLRKIALKIDILRFKKLIRRLEKGGVEYLISDRYFYDTLVNISFLEKRRVIPTVKIPKPDFSFFLDIEPEEIMKRHRKPGQGIDYLKDKKRYYIDLVKRYDIKTISADSGPEKLHSQLVEGILGKIK